MDAETTRERIARRLRERPMTAGELAEAVDSKRSTVVEHVRHVARSVDDGEVVVAPPTCRDCGFDGFDRPANLPSRCPECRSEAIDEPEFAIR
jgi:predicted Zn-ribbon and HTH transcriptional regulator